MLNVIRIVNEVIIFSPHCNYVCGSFDFFSQVEEGSVAVSLEEPINSSFFFPEFLLISKGLLKKNISLLLLEDKIICRPLTRNLQLHVIHGFQCIIHVSVLTLPKVDLFFELTLQNLQLLRLNQHKEAHYGCLPDLINDLTTISIPCHFLVNDWLTGRSIVSWLRGRRIPLS